MNDSILCAAFGVSSIEALLQLCETKKQQSAAYYAQPEVDFKLKRTDASDNSILMIDGRRYLVAGKGQYLGAGGYAVVKLVIGLDEETPLKERTYIVKREHTNHDYQKKELRIATKLGLAISSKVSRATTTNKLTAKGEPVKEKFYTLQKYYGESLRKKLASKTLCATQRLDYAIQLALAVHALHTQSPALAHRDVTLRNATVDEAGIVRLIDFGFSTEDHRIHALTSRCGTLSYLPSASHNFKKLSDFDNYALQVAIMGKKADARSLLEWDEVKKNGQTYMDVLVPNDQKTLSARVIAAHLIAIRAQAPIATPLNQEASKAVIDAYQKGEPLAVIQRNIIALNMPNLAQCITNLTSILTDGPLTINFLSLLDHLCLQAKDPADAEQRIKVALALKQSNIEQGLLYNLDAATWQTLIHLNQSQEKGGLARFYLTRVLADEIFKQTKLKLDLSQVSPEIHSEILQDLCVNKPFLLTQNLLLRYFSLQKAIGYKLHFKQYETIFEALNSNALSFLEIKAIVLCMCFKACNREPLTCSTIATLTAQTYAQILALPTPALTDDNIEAFLINQSSVYSPVAGLQIQAYLIYKHLNPETKNEPPLFIETMTQDELFALIEAQKRGEVKSVRESLENAIRNPSALSPFSMPGHTPSPIAPEGSPTGIVRSDSFFTPPRLRSERSRSLKVAHALRPGDDETIGSPVCK